MRVLVALGRIAHDAAVRPRAAASPPSPSPISPSIACPDGRLLIDSYHCSRYNQNTNRLTREMFEAVFARAVELAP